MKSSQRISIIIALLFTILLTGCSVTDQQEVKSSVLNAINSPEVQSIRNMTTDGVKLGDLFDAGMGSPTYELYDPAEDGNTYVTIKGNMIYKKTSVVVTIQYKKLSETEYEYYTLATNDIPTTELEANAFFQYFASEYEKKLANKTNLSDNKNLINASSTDSNEPEANPLSQEDTNTEQKSEINAVNDTEFKSYSNTRYGFSLKYPSVFANATESDNGDGITFYHNTNADILAFGTIYDSSGAGTTAEEYIAGLGYTNPTQMADNEYLCDRCTESSDDIQLITFKDGIAYHLSLQIRNYEKFSGDEVENLRNYFNTMKDSFIVN